MLHEQRFSPIILPHLPLAHTSLRVEIEALVRIYRKLVSNCKVTSKAATSGSVIAKPHSTVEVGTHLYAWLHVPHAKGTQVNRVSKAVTGFPFAYTSPEMVNGYLLGIK